MKSSPLISVVITCYNYGNFIEKALVSVLEQSHGNIEVIIIDDGSTDDSNDVCTQLAKKYDNVRFISQTNRGIIDTRNGALSEVKGEYLVFLDADDYLEKNYLTNTLKIAQNHKVDIVYTDYKMFGLRSEMSSFPEFSLEELKNHNFIHISSLVKMSSLKNIQFDTNMKKMSHEDWDFFLALCMNGATAKKCSTTYLNYRIHDVGRNNKLEDDDSRADFAQMYLYVTGKYSGLKLGGTSYLSGRIFSDWYIQMGYKVKGLNSEVNNLNNKLDSIEVKNQEYTAELKNIKNSKFYKTYKILIDIRSKILFK